LLALSALITLIGGCLDAPTAPRHGEARLLLAAATTSPLSLQGFPSLAATAVRVRIRRGQTLLRDTTAAFPPASDTLRLVLTVPAAVGEQLTAELRVLAESLVVLDGTAPVTARADASAPPDVVPVAYRGPGADATTLVVAPRAGVAEVTDSLLIAAGATNAQQQPVPQLLVAWSSSDTTIATVSSTGRVRARTNGDTWIVARTPNGLRDSSRIRVVGAAQLAAVGSTVGVAPSSTALTAPFAVQLRDGAARPIAGSRVAWQITGDGTFANGRTADTTVTDSAGIARVTPTTGASGVTAQVAARSVQFRAPAQIGFVLVTRLPNVTRVWVGNDVTTDWAASNNWAPAGAPVATDTLLIPLVPGPRTPTLSAPVTVASVQLSPGAALAMGAFDLTVTASWKGRGASASATSGRVVAAGAATAIEGVLPGLLVTAGRATISDSTSTTGDVTIADGTLAVTTAPLAVGGNLQVINSGYLEQALATSEIVVQGDAEFRGGVAGTGLTLGVLEVRGAFRTLNANNSDARTFTPAVGHVVRLAGSANQTISIATPAFGSQHFGTVQVSKTGGAVTVLTDLLITQDLLVTSATTVTGGRTITLFRRLNTSTGSSLSGLSNIDLVGTATDFPLVSGLPPAQLTLSNARTVSSSTVYPGNLRVVNGTLSVPSTTLSVGGDLDLAGNGYLGQPDAASVVSVAGNVFFRGAVASAGLAAGRLDVVGNFTVQNANNSDTRTFLAATAHTVRLIGGLTQTVTLASPTASNGQAFGSLIIDKSAGSVVFTSAAEIRRHLRVLSPTPVSATGTLSVTDSLSAVAGSDLDGVSLIALIGTGTTFPIVAGVGPDTLDLYSSRTVTTNQSYGRTVRVREGTLTVSGATLFIGGTLDVRDNGYLAQPDPASVLRVMNVFFRGGVAGTGLANGTLEVGGNFTVQNANNSDTRTFTPASTHTVRLYGGQLQTVTLASPTIATGQAFGSLLIDKTGNAVQFTSSAQLRRHFIVQSPTQVTATGTISVTDSLVTAAGSNLSGVPLIELFGTPTTFPLVQGLPPALLDILNNRTLTTNATYPGTLRIRDFTTTVSNATLTIGGQLDVRDFGYLAQPDAGSVVSVAGDVTFRGGVVASGLTNGRLDVGGNLRVFNANNSDTRTFAPGLAHTVRMVGATDQSITLQSPADGQLQQFGNLVIEKPAGRVTFGSAVRALGDLLVRSATVLDGAQTITVSDSVSTVAGSDLSGLSLLVLVGTSVVFPDVVGTPPPFLDVYNSRTITSATDYPGALRVRNGALTIGATTAIVRGAFSVIDNGYLNQADPLSLLDVRGNVLFAGGVVQSGMTAGELRVGGNFSTANANNSDARTFVPSGSHVTALVGAAATTVSMVSPAVGTQQFRNLRIANPAGVTALTPVLATGTLSGTGTLVTGGFNVSVSACTLSRSVISGALGGLATACPP
jgi:hypothetical protein